MTTETPTQKRFKLTRASWKNRTALSTARIVKLNGWATFLNWVADEHICLLTSRLTRGGRGHTRIERHPLMAAAVPTDWVDQMHEKNRAPETNTKNTSSYQVRQNLMPYCKDLYRAAAEGKHLAYRVQLYRRAGTRAHTDTASFSEKAFTLVSIPWLCQVLDTTEAELETVTAPLPWTDQPAPTPPEE